jgi:murein peptide amidase A
MFLKFESSESSLFFLEKISLNEQMQGKTLPPSSLTIESFPDWVKTSTGQSLALFQNLHRSDISPYLFVGGVHGDEPEGVRLAQEFLQWLQTHSSAADHPWILIPCLNPDGYQFHERTNANKVDLNRNFPSTDWLKAEKKDRYYSGPYANSEIEVQALVRLITEKKPKAIIHFHSWKPCVVYTGVTGKKISDLLTKGNGYESREDIGYPTPGSLGQYGWLNHQIPVICIEEQERSDLDLVWPHFKTGLTELIKGKGL